MTRREREKEGEDNKWDGVGRLYMTATGPNAVVLVPESEQSGSRSSRTRSKPQD